MKNAKRFLALVLALVMCLGAFAGCGKTEENTTPLVIGYSPFSSKFSPFFVETAYDQDVVKMTQVGLLESDRTGAIIMNGIEGETISYNGTDYTYNGISNLEVVENADGTVDYNFTIKDGVKFSDGKELTVDDVIFSMYVFSDPTYDGSTTFFALPIEGMEAYRSGVSTLSSIIAGLGEDTTDFTNATQEQVTAFWTEVNNGGTAFAQEIVDYMAENYKTTTVAEAAGMWGFELDAAATAKDFFLAIGNAYDWNFSAMEKETAGTALADLISADVYGYSTVGVQTGESAPSITGIKKTGDNTLTVTLTEVDATAIYQLGLYVTPLHYYGNADEYDYDNNKFGFTKGDLSSIRAKTTVPMGAGPYKFNKFENGVVYFEANDTYFKGKPATKYVNFLETQDTDKLNGVTTGTVDISDPSFSKDTATAIQTVNGGELNGNVITVTTTNNLGYGYLGMSANCVNVNGEPASDASKNLRKALATVFAAYRDVTVDSYYGEAASVINYPISNTSWAAPQVTDDGYKVAFSVDAQGNDIYTSGMTSEQKYEAALNAALTFFEAAGYTVADGKVTAAPAGAKTNFEVLIPADGAGDHPSFMMLTLASEAFTKIGIDMKVTDLTNSSDLWTAIESEQAELWCAAWGASVDPDMFQIYHPQGGSNYMYDINDDDLSTLIMEARKSLDQTYRKGMYKACLDIVVDWAVEVPVYQRQNAFIFSTERVNMDTVAKDITTFYGWIAEVEKIEKN